MEYPIHLLSYIKVRNISSHYRYAGRFYIETAFDISAVDVVIHSSHFA